MGYSLEKYQEECLLWEQEHKRKVFIGKASIPKWLR